jgi:hypothetical protein
MIVSNLNDVEVIVKNNPSLSWDGWNIVCLIQDDYAEYLPIGVFDKITRQWYKKTTYPCNDKGWDLPESVI